MARVAILCLLALAVVISTLATVAEARKRDKSVDLSKWDKKSFFKSLSHHGAQINAMDEKGGKMYTPQIHGKHLGGDSDEGLFRKKWRKGGRGKHGRHNKKSRKSKKFNRHKAAEMTKHSPWSGLIRPGTECEQECKRNEICIKGPLDALSHCIHIKDLKRSMKKFRKYKKKEKKAWRKFHKKSEKHFKHNNILNLSSNGTSDDTAVIKAKAHSDMEKELNRKKEELVNAEGRKIFDIVPAAPSEAGDPKGCSTKDFSQIRNRIMGWFHLLRSHNKKALKEDKKLKEHRHSVKKQMDAGDTCKCMKSAMWEFHQMDKDEDDHLTDKEMALLEENAMEPCIKPYLTSCDRDADGYLSSAEWCCCFSGALAPCYRKMDEIKRSRQPVTFMPRCDKEGYYIPEQCQRIDDTNFECWCVDYNGNVAEETKTKGRADCKAFE
ncbi:hypothetical protein EGW08_020414 [Elysia chlorotica]|uniref:Thyroglobulin type-1 domain-containing protein n=1 Tax=Elysia chlorotica TaxID=188477 RepID=A0A433SRC7_ELYCH|nr:hypothetical protein EGW08_020414 [Elysia chlorotica]